MKTLVLFTLALLGAVAANASQPKIRLYLSNDSTIEFNLDQIDSLTFVNSEISANLTVYNHVDSLTKYYDTKDITKITFDGSAGMHIVLADTVVSQTLSGIDSITVQPKAQRFLSLLVSNDIFYNGTLFASSFVDYKRGVDTHGDARIIISDDGLPQIIIISDTSQNMLAMGIARSTDTSIRINALSSTEALVFQNATIMGMPLAQGTDSVVNFIDTLTEVNYVASIIQDSVGVRPLSDLLSDSLKAILRIAYVKTYEYATGLPYNVVKRKDKNVPDQILVTPLPVYPPSLGGVNVSAIQDAQGTVHVTIQNTKRRHINVRLNGSPSQGYPMGPGIPISGSTLSGLLDNSSAYPNPLTLPSTSPGILTVETCGPSLLGSNAYPNKLDLFYVEPWSRTFLSLACSPIEIILSGLFGSAEFASKQVEVLGELYTNLGRITAAASVQNDLQNGNTAGAIVDAGKYALTDDFIIKIGFDVFGKKIAADAASTAAGLFTALWNTLDVFTILPDLYGISEDCQFELNTNPNGRDFTPPSIQILSPTDNSNVTANSIVPISVHLTDDQNIKKVSFYVDYSSTPADSHDFGTNAGTSGSYTFLWQDAGLVGMHYISIQGSDASGNTVNALLTLNITPAYTYPNGSVILSENFEGSAMDSRISVISTNNFTTPPGIKPMTQFGGEHAYGFGVSPCQASCFSGYQTALHIALGTPTYVSTVSFKEMELFGNWGSTGYAYADGVSIISPSDPQGDGVQIWGRIPENDHHADNTYRTHTYSVNKVVSTIDLTVSDITNQSELFLDNLVIRGK